MFYSMLNIQVEDIFSLCKYMQWSTKMKNIGGAKLGEHYNDLSNFIMNITR